jgi:hypothetical protein
VTAGGGHEHQHSAERLVAAQVHVVARRAEAVLLGIPAPGGPAGGNDESLPGKAARQPLPPRGAVARGADRPDLGRLQGRPFLPHEGVQRRRDRQVVVAGLERLSVRRVGWLLARECYPFSHTCVTSQFRLRT